MPRLGSQEEFDQAWLKIFESTQHPEMRTITGIALSLYAHREYPSYCSPVIFDDEINEFFNDLESLECPGQFETVIDHLFPQSNLERFNIVLKHIIELFPRFEDMKKSCILGQLASQLSVVMGSVNLSVLKILIEMIFEKTENFKAPMDKRSVGNDWFKNAVSVICYYTDHVPDKEMIYDILIPYIDLLSLVYHEEVTMTALV
jgi:hypothetical protein